ncbi:MAG: YaiI/YqxD family protein [Hyphomicrobiaceae bacterium]
MKFYVDADACPVKDAVVRVAERHNVQLFFVSNSWMKLPNSGVVERVVVSAGPDVADDWIAERCTSGDIVVTSDIPLASRCVKAGAKVLAPDGKAFSESSIGMALAMRDLMTDLRETSGMQTHNKAFMPRDRSRFLDAMERLVQDIKHGR